MRRSAASLVLTLAIGLAGLRSSADSPPPGVAAQSTAPAASANATAGVQPPREDGSVRFAVIGDTGTGTPAQVEVGRRLADVRGIFPFEFVLMLGDNLYGSERPQDFARKFEQPYSVLLDAKVPFYASLGNHDDPTQRYYKPFNMNGERFYTFTRGDARFFALDSNYMDQVQLRWLEEQLARAGDRWMIAFFHHPLYSSGGRHGSEVDLREQVEPLFIRYGIDAVFAGHEHFYERIRPQRGIYYFTAGGSGKLARGDIRRTALTAAGFDTDLSFMLVELGERAMHFQALSRVGRLVDSGSLPLLANAPQTADAPQRR